MHHGIHRDGQNVFCLPICLGIGCHGAGSRFTPWLIPERHRGSKEICLLSMVIGEVNPIRY